jgi:hypothetical protein
MKHYIITSIILISCQLLFAQSIFESAYVFEGKTFQLTIPPNYYSAIGLENNMVYFSEKKGLKMEDLKDGKDLNGFMIMQLPKNGKTFDDMLNEISSNLIESSVTFNSVPEKKKINNENYIFTSVDIKNVGTINPHVSMYIGEFGDYFYLLNCYGNNSKTVAEVDDFSKKIISSFKIIKTTKESTIYTYPFYVEEDIEDDYTEEIDESNNYDIEEFGMSNGAGNYGYVENDSEFYINALFETSLTYEDSYFEYEDISDNWSESYDGDKELLIASDYYNALDEKEGSVKLFSAGKISNYPTLKDYVTALALVYPEFQNAQITMSGDFAGDFSSLTEIILSFKKYDVKFERTTPSSFVDLFTTTYKGELVFVVVYKDNNASNHFISDYLNLVKSLLFFEIMDYDPDAE